MSISIQVWQFFSLWIVQVNGFGDTKYFFSWNLGWKNELQKRFKHFHVVYSGVWLNTYNMIFEENVPAKTLNPYWKNPKSVKLHSKPARQGS